MGSSALGPARDSRRQLALVVAAILLATVVALRLMGRRWWCAAGDLSPWAWDTRAAHMSQHLLDPYSFTHVEHGLVYFALLSLVARRRSFGVRLALAIALASGWELLENSSFVIERYRSHTIDVGYYGDSILNSLADIACCAAGFWFAARVRWWWTLALFGALEVGLLATIRDSLVLNVVMLLHRFDGLLAWQARRGS